ncbi:MAG: MFS transporter, partial [Planctomycetota bacterium]
MNRTVRNVTLNAVGDGVWGFQYEGLAALTVLPVLLKAYGASLSEIGLVGAIECMVLLAQVLGIYVFRSRRHRQRQLVLWFALVALPLFALMGVVNHSAAGLSLPGRRWALLGTFAAYLFATGVGAGAWNDWLTHLFDRSIRGRVIGLGWGAFSLCGSVGSLCVGWIVFRTVEGSDDPNRYDVYSYLYFGATGIGLVGCLLYSLIKDTGADDAVDTPAPKLPELLKRFGHSLADRNFRRFLIGRMLATLGFSIAALITAYYKSSEGGGLAGWKIIALGAAIPVGRATSFILLGALGDRHGHRLGVVIGAGIQVATVAIVLTTSGPISCLVAYVGLGLGLGAGWICGFNMSVESCPH